MHDTTPVTDDAPLKDITPRDAFDLYLKDRRADGAAESTIRSHKSRLGHFFDWFEAETEYEYLSELDGYDLKLYKIEQYGEKDKGWDDYSTLTVKSAMDTLRRYLKFAAEIQAVPIALPYRVKSPSKGDDGQRDNEIDDSRAKQILEHLDRYEYASFDHASAHLIWYTMIRVGAARAIDLQDIDWDDRYIKLRHRPPQTPLKKKEDSERKASISKKTAAILEDYIDENRFDVEDDEGRDPLFTTQNGRASLTTLRNNIYALTCPCVYGDGCPHGRDPQDCQAAKNKNDACECPSSESTHAIRRGSITWHLREETNKEVVSERADVSVRVIDKHYNELTQEEKMEIRRDHLPDEL